MEPFRPTYAEIDLNKLRHNIAAVKKILAPGTKFMAIVKADAYGHGATEIARAAEKAGADFLGVASLGEAIELRASSVTAPILILSETSHKYVDRLVTADLTQTVYTPEFAQMISDIAAGMGRKAKVHVKVDTGMGRVGVLPEKAIAFIKKIKTLPGLELEGIFTHFSKADDQRSDFTALQFERFMDVLDAAKKEGIDIPIKHAANSAAAVFFPQTQLDMVRIGICMYGLYPSGKRIASLDLQPVLSFKTKVLYVKEVPKGTSLSYGATYTTSKNTRVATLPVGYADGLSRGLSNNGSVIIRGKRYPIVGRVTMDMTLVDADGDRIEAGDDAVIIGKQEREEITADEIAMRDDTINYEVICGIGKRVPRVYVG